MPPFQPRPYARGGTIGELIRLRGRNAADAELRGGDIAAQLYANLGQQLSGIISGYAREQQEAPIRAMQAEGAKLDLEAKRNAVEAENRLNRQDSAFMALLEQQPNPDPREVMSIYGPQRGMAIAQGLHAFGELQTGAVKDARDTAGRLAMGVKSLSPQAQAQFWPSIRAAAVKGGLGSEQDIPEQPTPEYLDAVIGWATGQGPAAPKTREIKTRNADGSESIQIVEDTPGQSFTSAAAPKEVTFGQPVAAMVNGRRAFVRPGSDGQSYSMAGQAITGPVTPIVDAGADNEPLVSIVGDDGKPVLVRRRDAVGKTPATGSQKPATGLERRALNFFNRARQADLDLEALEDDIRGMGLLGQGWQAIAPNFLQTDLGQLYTQSQRAFTEARLRKDSGAAIPAEEFENDRKTYFVQPGDSPETIEQKHRARAAILSSLGFESGQALGEFVGDPDEAARIVGDYKTRSERKDTSPDPNTQTPNLSGLGEGRIRKFSAGPFKGQEWAIVNGEAKRVK